MGKRVKTSVINFRVSEEEKQMIRKEAEDLGMDISKYLLHLVKDKKVVVIEGGRELAMEVYRLNQNLNRLGNYPFVDVQALRDLVSDGVAKISKMEEGM